MNFDSRTYRDGNIFRVIGDLPTEITATVLIPEGYALQTADRIRLFTIGADHVVNEITVDTNALDRAQTATLTLNAGYDALTGTDDLDAYIAASTAFRAGSKVHVENGGDDPFAAGVVNALTESLDVVLSPQASASSTAGSGAVGPAVGGGLITVTAKISRRQPTPAAGTRYFVNGRGGLA